MNKLDDFKSKHKRGIFGVSRVKDIKVLDLFFKLFQPIFNLVIFEINPLYFSIKLTYGIVILTI